MSLLAVVSMLVATPRASAETLPTVTYTVSGIAGTNGWYRGSAGGDYVVVNWTISDPDHLVKQGCVSPAPVLGPTMGTRAMCTLTFIDDRPPVSYPTALLKIDRDPPTAVAANVARAPDFNGWYNHVVSVSWSGQDATSGIAGCSSSAYQGPDKAGIALAGGCTDNAGNGADSNVVLNYDATPPELVNVAVKSAASADVVRWSSSSPGDRITIRRTIRGDHSSKAAAPPIFDGSAPSYADKKVAPGVEYLYNVQAVDQAGNASGQVSVAGLPKVLTLRKLAYVPRAAPNPILRWPAVRRATYYNIQLYRGTKRVFASWPRANQLGLPAKWKWAGKRRHLTAGRYRWYVWAGIGKRSFARYQAVGSAQFIVPSQ